MKQRKAEAFPAIPNTVADKMLDCLVASRSQKTSISRHIQNDGQTPACSQQMLKHYSIHLLTHCGRVICVFNTVKLGTPASSP